MPVQQPKVSASVRMLSGRAAVKRDALAGRRRRRPARSRSASAASASATISSPLTSMSRCRLPIRCPTRAASAMIARLDHQHVLVGRRDDDTTARASWCSSCRGAGPCRSAAPARARRRRAPRRGGGRGGDRARSSAARRSCSAGSAVRAMRVQRREPESAVDDRRHVGRSRTESIAARAAGSPPAAARCVRRRS